MVYFIYSIPRTYVPTIMWHDVVAGTEIALYK